MKSYISEIDSNRFGFKIAKVNSFESSPAEIIKELKKKGVKMIISRVGCNEIELINKLEAFKFQTMDFQVCYKYDLVGSSINQYNNETDFIINEADTSDTVSLIEIAAHSFDQYGHYFADKRLEENKCKEIYSDWINRSLNDKNVADIVFVAKKENQIAGFLSFKINNDKSQYAAGVQGAVAEKFRNQSVFRLLVQQGILWSSNLKLKWVEHNVLLTNYPVNRSLVSLGFIPINPFITMHCWLD